MTSAEHFEATMRDIWAGESADALAIARLNATEIGPTTNGMDEPAYLFRFPDGSHATVSTSGVILDVKDQAP